MGGNSADLFSLEIGSQKLPGVKCVRYAMRRTSNCYGAANMFALPLVFERQFQEPVSAATG